MTTISHILIVGAGLGGLACAVACRQVGLEVTILERAPLISNVEAGIQIPPNSSRVLRALGLLHKVAPHATIMDHLDVRRYADGTILCQKPLGPTQSRNTDQNGYYHKVMMDEALRLGATLILDASVKSIDSTGTTVLLEDGTSRTADIVVGADGENASSRLSLKIGLIRSLGLWSTLRESFLDRYSPPAETGELAYRATFTLAQLNALEDPRVKEICSRKAVTLWMGPEKHVVFYPLRGGEEFNLVLSRPDNLPAGMRTSEGDISEMRATFQGWDVMLTKLISCIPSVLKWKLMHHEELQSWVQGHAVLLGDACHPALPYQAQGAAMAVEDGATLGFLLGTYKDSVRRQQGIISQRGDTIHGLLKLYEQLRKERTTLNVRGAYQNRAFYHMLDGPQQRARDEQMSRFDFNHGRSEYLWLDTEYSMNLLGYDVLADARTWYGWWEQGESFEDILARRASDGVLLMDSSWRVPSWPSANTTREQRLVSSL